MIEKKYTWNKLWDSLCALFSPRVITTAHITGEYRIPFGNNPRADEIFTKETVFLKNMCFSACAAGRDLPSFDSVCITILLS